MTQNKVKSKSKENKKSKSGKSGRKSKVKLSDIIKVKDNSDSDSENNNDNTELDQNDEESDDSEGILLYVHIKDRCKLYNYHVWEIYLQKSIDDLVDEAFQIHCHACKSIDLEGKFCKCVNCGFVECKTCVDAKVAKRLFGR